MNASEPPSPILFFDTLTAYQNTAALKGALELKLFTAIGQPGATAAELAARCSAAERGIRILADYLTILGFLEKIEGRYSLTRDSAVFLDEKSPAYAGAAAAFLLSPAIKGAFDELAAAVRKGGTAQSPEGTMAPEHPVWIDFARGMAPMMIPPAQALAELLPLDASRPSRILDIAAGHGVYGIAVAQKNPRTQVVAVDWAPVLAVARENAKAAGLANRFSTIEGSAFEVDLGGDYDIVLIPNFLHHFDPPACVTFLKKVYPALRPGGCVAVVEFVPNPDRVTPPEAASFSLVMLATTAAGDAYTFSELDAMLKEAGFSEIRQHPLPPSVATAVIAQK
ncbi:MAG TPA: class I SAM-dependent methyltransferase [Chthoniobacterales bacterium]|nr:class I SAM-dependent methyltransferase [Chthoniobacterales bacterium]